MRLHGSPSSLAPAALLLSAASGIALPQVPGVGPRDLASQLASIGASILNPILSAVEAVLAGDGLTQAALGALEGAVNIEATYDYVVVGGGTGGNAIGYRLAEAGHSVAILEAGEFYEFAKPVLGSTPGADIIGVGASSLDEIGTVDWEIQTTPQAGANNRQVHYARGKCLGGSSALNFMLHQRGSTGSYDMWADQVGDDSYRLPSFINFFKKSVSFTAPDWTKRRANTSATTQWDPNAFTTPGGPVQVGYTNWVSVFATWLEQGLKSAGVNMTTGFASGQLLGYHYAQTTIRPTDETRSSSAQYIYQAISENLSTLKVYTSTRAKKVLFNANKQATGVTVNSGGVDYTINAAKEVILSAGAFQSPQLLMVSGIGPQATLAQHNIPVLVDLPGVGQNMWDHIFFGPSYQVNFDTLDRVLHDPVNLAETLAEYVATQTGALTSNVVELLAWEKLPDKYRSTWSAATQQKMAQFPADWPEVEHLSGNGYIGNFRSLPLQQPLNLNQYATDLGALVAPVSRGNVTIASADTADLPIVNPNWLTDPADQEVAVSWYRRMREVWATPAMQSQVIGPEYYPGPSVQTDAQILAVIRDSLMTVWHASCTCKMGRANDTMAVVDSDAKVFGVQGVRVVDASSFAILPPGHPQSTVYALAEKIADRIINP